LSASKFTNKGVPFSSVESYSGNNSKSFPDITVNNKKSTNRPFMHVHSTQPHIRCALPPNTASTLSWSTPSSANASRAISYQLLAFDCARETGDGAEPKIIRPNPNASTAGPTEEQDRSKDERERQNESAEQLTIHLDPALPVLLLL
jgi:hypothetical protein